MYQDMYLAQRWWEGSFFLNWIKKKEENLSYDFCIDFWGYFSFCKKTPNLQRANWVNQNSLCQALSSVLPVSWILVFFISCVSNISIEKIKILKDGSIQTIIAIIFFSSILSLILFINGINVHYEWLVTEKIAVSIFVGYSQFPENS